MITSNCNTDQHLQKIKTYRNNTFIPYIRYFIYKLDISNTLHAYYHSQQIKLINHWYKEGKIFYDHAHNKTIWERLDAKQKLIHVVKYFNNKNKLNFYQALKQHIKSRDACVEPAFP